MFCCSLGKVTCFSKLRGGRETTGHALLRFVQQPVSLSKYKSVSTNQSY